MNKLVLLATIILLSTQVVPTTQRTLRINENGLKSETFLSPRIDLEPGSVCNKYFFNLGFPKGHIAVKAFDGELVDEVGDSVPLHEAYMHHWLIGRYFVREGMEHTPSTIVNAPNSGFCEELWQHFGLGAETRKTNTSVPDPFGIEVGTPPLGFQEGWMVNIHIIDTRGVVDKRGCAECWCDLMHNNVTEHQDLPNGYKGGIRCCEDGARCRLKEGHEYESGGIRGLYLKYTVTYVDWNPSIIPVHIYIFDVTDTLKLYGDNRHICQLEFQVDPCSDDTAKEDCVYSRSVSVNAPISGDIVYGVAHQHAGGIGSTLYGEDGRVLCTSLPTYGNGTEAGNEDGYLVGMSACYPQPGSIKIAMMEKLTVVSNYSNAQLHTGVMGHFYILVAESSTKSSYPILQSLDEGNQTYLEL